MLGTCLHAPKKCVITTICDMSVFLWSPSEFKQESDLKVVKDIRDIFTKKEKDIRDMEKRKKKKKKKKEKENINVRDMFARA